MEAMIILAVILGVALILWVVLNHRSTMEHLRARRDGSLDRSEYERGVRDGLLKAAKLVSSLDADQDDYVGMIKAAAGSDENTR